MTREEALQALRGKETVWFFRDGRPVVGRIVEQLDDDFIVCPIDKFNNPSDYCCSLEEIYLVPQKKTANPRQGVVGQLWRLFSSFSPARLL